jgi:segregation and condensation protein B
MNLTQKIEAILFFKGEPMSIKRLMEILKVSKEEIGEAIIDLDNNLKEKGIVLLEKNDEVTLGTNPELSELIEHLQKEELNKELSKASLETLSIVLYKDGVTRAEIDYIRGVNSSFTLRMLSIRGLVEKIADPKDARRYIYKPTFDLLSYMGVKNVEELPEYKETNQNLTEAGTRMEEEIKEAEGEQ